jgi:hypothetical protein
MGTLEKFVLIEDCKKQIDYIMLLSTQLHNFNTRKIS